MFIILLLMDKLCCKFIFASINWHSLQLLVLIIGKALIEKRMHVGWCIPNIDIVINFNYTTKRNTRI